MNAALWILQIPLAVTLVGAGLTKVTMPRTKVRNTLGDWGNTFPTSALKLLGLTELAAAIGLIVPPPVSIAPILTPMTPAIGIGGVMACAAVVAWGRFGPHAF